MYRQYLASLVILLYLAIPVAHARITPQNGDTLNFRLVPFIVDTAAAYKNYTLEIAAGSHTTEKDFKKNIIISTNSTNGQWVEIVPSWNSPYTWRVIYSSKNNKKKHTSPLYTFRTGNSVYTDTSKYRMRIIDTATAYKDMFIIVDFAPVMFDMKGNVVWYIPDIPGIIGPNRGLRDIKPTADGTFTVNGIEIDYYGKVLWKAPDKGIVSGDTSEHYHHEFTKLENGHYMLAGMEQLVKEIPTYIDTTNFYTDNSVLTRNNKLYKIIDCPTLIEYDKDGRIIWSWKLSQHFDEREYFIRRQPAGILNAHPHLNSFDFDEQNNVIYASLRNCDRIIKIKYPEGIIIANYGLYLDSNGKIAGEKLFHAQHCAKLIPGGDLILFNNNTDRERNVTSYIQRFSQPADGKGNLVKQWEFGCDIDKEAPSCGMGGGSVSLLPGGAILAGMGLAGRCFIVSPEKQILWNAIPEYKTDVNTWQLLPVYRNTFIPNKEYILKFIR